VSPKKGEFHQYFRIVPVSGWAAPHWTSSLLLPLDRLKSKCSCNFHSIYTEKKKKNENFELKLNQRYTLFTLIYC
jgi:hypothetical protein